MFSAGVPDQRLFSADVNEAKTQADSEPMDPINQLKDIFKQKKKVYRGPLETNHIMAKYRNKNYASSQHIKSQKPKSRNGFGHTFAPPTGKAFAEDLTSEIPQLAENASLRTSHNNGPSIKDRLESMRKMFAEEDINDQVKGIQNEWELEDQKIPPKRLE